jgi:hypothetical protein
LSAWPPQELACIVPTRNQAVAYDMMRSACGRFAQQHQSKTALGSVFDAEAKRITHEEKDGQ